MAQKRDVWKTPLLGKEHLPMGCGKLEVSYVARSVSRGLLEKTRWGRAFFILELFASWWCFLLYLGASFPSSCPSGQPPQSKTYYPKWIVILLPPIFLQPTFQSNPSCLSLLTLPNPRCLASSLLPFHSAPSASPCRGQGWAAATSLLSSPGEAFI